MNNYELINDGSILDEFSGIIEKQLFLAERQNMSHVRFTELNPEKDGTVTYLVDSITVKEYLMKLKKDSE